MNNSDDQEMDVCGCRACVELREQYHEGVEIEIQDLPTAQDKRDYLVTATLQLVVSEPTHTDATIAVKELLNEIIEHSVYRLDPMNGAVIVCVDELNV